MTTKTYLIMHDGNTWAVYRTKRSVAFHGTRTECTNFCIRNGLNYRTIR